jgi:hypothetical protein
VQPVVVAEVADELYALTPAEFTAARDERSRQVRAAGQRDEAAAIKKFARPTASAWLVNQLARSAPDQMNRLYELGAALQEAQRTLAGDRLRELSVQRRQVIHDILPTASELAGRASQPASAAVLGEVRATLEAALADADARDAVRSGRLTKALTYAGLGEVDLTAALALAPEPRAPGGRGRVRRTDTLEAGPLSTGTSDADFADGATPRRTGAGRTAKGEAGRDGKPGSRAPQPPASVSPSAGDQAQRAAEAVQAAQATVDEGAGALDQAEGQVAGVAEQRQFLRRRISHLERELGEARKAYAGLAKEGQQAERARDAASRALESAKRLLEKARRQAGDPG